ncbi:MAG: prepilin-type N-terminal cleavage/methylation domain-containing protein [Proteobacteria bacterium]|nr:prepilin-type N-terminal cleavage/methylation domain-containing protein [Pseudomonadota bacterium]
MKMSFFTMCCARRRGGFTLLELSMVTVVVALILGALVVGSDMIHVSKMHRTLVQVETIKKAVKLFRDKYHELPGDLSNAISFWGSESACPPAYTANPHKATCNGNGNGHIGDVYTDGGATSYELYRAWQHMANALYYEGAYNGMSGTGSSNESLTGVNVPSGALEGTSYTLLYIFQPAGNVSYWPAQYGHGIVFGKQLNTSINAAAALTPKEAFALDTKIDDSRPAYGTVMGYKAATSPNCSTTDVASNAVYNTSYAPVACSLIFITGF